MCICIGARGDDTKKMYESIVKNDTIDPQFTRQIGKYTVVGQNHKNGCLFRADGLKIFMNIPIWMVAERDITKFITTYRTIHPMYKHSLIGGNTDEEFYLHALILQNDEITAPITRQVGKYTIVGQNHKNGSLFNTEGLKHFSTIAFEKVTEQYITNFITEFRLYVPDETKFNAKFEAGRKIVEEKEKVKREAERKIAEEKEAQTNEHVALIASALKKNPAILSIVLKEYPEILQETLSKTLSKILPNILHTELQDFRKELSSSLHAKLPDILRSMMEE
jgi:hypothetical protein